MKIKPLLTQFHKVRLGLEERKRELSAEMALIDAVLAGRPPSENNRLLFRKYGARLQAVKAALADGPKTKSEIIALLEKGGVALGAKPRVAVLYTKHFKRSGERFALAS